MGHAEFTLRNQPTQKPLSLDELWMPFTPNRDFKSDPRIVVAVSIDEPSAGGYYGGAVAAPVFSDIVSSTLRRLGVRPDAPVDSLVAVADQGGHAR